MHIVASPYRPPRLRSSCSSVAAMRAPLAPSGWPSAIEPPLTFVFAGSNRSSRMHAIACAAKASLISTRSRSSDAQLRERERFASRRYRPKAHHVRSDAGGSAGDEARDRLQTEPSRRLRFGKQQRSRSVIDSRRVAGGHASIAGNAGLSFASASIVVAGRGCSSRVTSGSCAAKPLSSSSANFPLVIASAALRCDSRAKRS